MKTITFFKRVLASAALVSVCGFACATNNGKQFIHNDTMEGGKLVCREIYAMNDAASGILNPVKMYKYTAYGKGQGPCYCHAGTDSVAGNDC